MRKDGKEEGGGGNVFKWKTVLNIMKKFLFLEFGKDKTILNL